MLITMTTRISFKNPYVWPLSMWRPKFSLSDQIGLILLPLSLEDQTWAITQPCRENRKSDFMIGLITSAVIKYSLLVLSLQQPMNFLKCIADSTVVKSVSEIYLEQSDLSENNQLKATSVISIRNIYGQVRP